MSRYRFLLWIGSPILIALVSLMGCSSSDKLGIEPATITFQDVFTCKGISQDNKWVGVTDVFLPSQDPYVVVVAQLDKNDLKKKIVYELMNPNNNIALSETKSSMTQNPLGIYFPISELMKRGGKGQWKANVFADGVPVAQAVFNVGEKTDKEDEIDGPQFFVVGSETAEDENEPLDTLSDDDRFGSYIREATPELSIPMPKEPDSATATIERASP